MSFDYAELATLATDLLTEFGQAVTRRSYTAGAYNLATGTTTPTTADTSRIGALFDFTPNKTTERGTLIQTGDKQLLLDPTAAVSLQDHLIVGGVEYIIISVGEVNPAGTVVLYDLHVRVG